MPQPTIQPLRKLSVTDAVARQILQWIRGGTLAPGSRLPSEGELVRQMGVSRPSVREALRGLAVLGVIQARQGAGYFVAAGGPLEALPVESLRDTLDQMGVFEVIEVSELLETGVAALAVERATPDDLGRLEDNLTESARLVARGEVSYDRMGEFHRLLAASCRNAALVEITHLMHRICARGERPVHEQHLIDESLMLAEHRAIYEAIAARDAPAARDRMADHLRSMRAAYERAIAGRVVEEAAAVLEVRSSD